MSHVDERGCDFLELRHGAKTYTPARADAAGADEGEPGVTARLAGRRVLVVGAGTRPSDDPDAPIGNGRAISVLAAREGAAVACADVDRDAAAETARLVEAEGGRAEVIVGDVTDEATCARMVAEAVLALGGLDGVVCNVGIGLGRGLEGTSVDDWDRCTR